MANYGPTNISFWSNTARANAVRNNQRLQHGSNIWSRYRPYTGTSIPGHSVKIPVRARELDTFPWAGFDMSQWDHEVQTATYATYAGTVATISVREMTVRHARRWKDTMRLYCESSVHSRLGQHIESASRPLRMISSWPVTKHTVKARGFGN